MFKKQISFEQLLKHNNFVTLTNNAHYFFFILLIVGYLGEITGGGLRFILDVFVT